MLYIKIYFYIFFVIHIYDMYIVFTQLKIMHKSRVCPILILRICDKIYLLLIHCSYRNCWSVRSIRSMLVEGWRIFWCSYTSSIGYSSCLLTPIRWMFSSAHGCYLPANNCNTWNRSWNLSWSWAQLWILWCLIAVNSSRYIEFLRHNIFLIIFN